MQRCKPVEAVGAELTAESCGCSFHNGLNAALELSAASDIARVEFDSTLV